MVGYVLEPGQLRVRVVVGQDAIGLIRNRTEAVVVRLSERMDAVFPGVVEREVPAASDQLPSAALGTAGGGSFALDPRAGDVVTAIDTVFQLDVLVDVAATSSFVGGRVYVLFDHGPEPIAWQAYRSLKRVFLRRFGV
jgi:putative peptide zinc metalloprotease protein